MALSVSSERAFSSAGITICKQCNHLDGDIVEALQCLKVLICQDLMLRDIMTIAKEEARFDLVDEEWGNADNTTDEVVNGEDNMQPPDDGEGVDMDGDDTDIDLTGSLA